MLRVGVDVVCNGMGLGPAWYKFVTPWAERNFGKERITVLLYVSICILILFGVH